MAPEPNELLLQIQTQQCNEPRRAPESRNGRVATFLARVRHRNWRNHFIRQWLRIHGVEMRGPKPWCTGRFPSIHVDRNAHIIVAGAATFGSRARIAAYGTGVIEIGEGAFINTYGGAIIARTRITIGAHCLVADHVVICDDSFHDVSPSSRRRLAPITIGRNVWLSSYVRVVPGVSISDHTVVGAGAVITHDLPDRCRAGGVPARVIRQFACPNDWYRE